MRTRTRLCLKTRSTSPSRSKRKQLLDQIIQSVGFQIRLRAVGISVTVTVSGAEETSIKAIQPVTSLSSFDLLDKNPLSLGDALDRQLGIARRSFGPGTSRPVLRGFDGDRVLVLQDGNRIGSLGFQSGDHAEPLDFMNLEKLEVVKGPATLLYGSNAIGGVVNAISGHESAHPGARLPHWNRRHE